MAEKKNKKKKRLVSSKRMSPIANIILEPRQGITNKVNISQSNENPADVRALNFNGYPYSTLTTRQCAFINAPRRNPTPEEIAQADREEKGRRMKEKKYKAIFKDENY